MKHKTIHKKVKATSTWKPFVEDPNGEIRYAYTLAGFAKLFGFERDWAYKKYKAGSLKAITNLGQVLIPASEFYRLEQEATYKAVTLAERETSK